MRKCWRQQIKVKTVEAVSVDSIIYFLLEYKEDIIEALEDDDSVALEDMINMNVPVLKCRISGK